MTMNRVQGWIERCDNFHQELLPLHNVLLSPTFGADEHRVLAQLSTACLRSTGSVLVLLENDRHWDSEIVLRSVQEGSIKFAFLLSDKTQLELSLREFSDAQFDIASLKTHQKVTTLIDIFRKRDKEVNATLSALALPKPEYDQISARYPRKLRNQIEEKWGFTGLIKRLAASNSPAAELFPMLLHGYGMASHLQHADAVGIGMVSERENRAEPERQKVKIAHIVRILSDCNAYSFMRLMSAYTCAGANLNIVSDVWKKHEKSFDDLTEALREWM